MDDLPSKVVWPMILLLCAMSRLSGQAEDRQPPERAGRNMIPIMEIPRLHMAPRSKKTIPVTLPVVVQADSEQDGWIRVRSDDVEGWLPRDKLIPVQEAVGFFSEEIRKHPAEPRPLLARAYGYREAGQLQLARKDLDKVLALTQPTASLHILRGNISLDMRNWNLAIADYSEAIRLSPMDPLPYYNRAQVWAAEGLADKALADCTQAIKLKPTWADPYVHRGNLYSEQKQYDQAIKDYSEALRLSPNHVGILTNRAMSSFDHGDLEKALSDCNAIIQLDSHHHQAMYYRAQIWLKKKVYNKALHDLDSCLKREPESLVLRYQLATVLATCPDSKSRDGKRAVDIAKALSLEAESKYPPFLELLASAYAECSDFSRAVEWQKRALKEWEHTKDDRTTPPQHAAIPYVRQLLSRSPKDQKDESLRRLRLYEQQRPYRQE